MARWPPQLAGQRVSGPLHADLQNNGVRCEFAPHDIKIGDKILDASRRLEQLLHR